MFNSWEGILAITDEYEQIICYLEDNRIIQSFNVQKRCVTGWCEKKNYEILNLYILHLNVFSMK